MEKLVMFSFQNMYLQGIHAGIQSGHCWVRMINKYMIHNAPTNQANTVHNWQYYNHTVAIKNGGDQAALQDIIELFKQVDNPYPWEQWHEGEKSLNGALTNVSIIVPEHVYGYVPTKQPKHRDNMQKPSQKLDGFDKRLYTLLTSCKNMI